MTASVPEHVPGSGHVIIVAIGSAGDVHPFLGIGQTLLRRGHRVTLCANPAFQDLAERCGLRFLPVGTLAAYAGAMNNPSLWNPRTSLRTLWDAVACDMRPLFDTLCGEIDEHTVLLGSLWAFSARLIQERFGVPYLSVQVSPSTLLSAHEPPVHARFTLPRGLPSPAKAALIWLIERTVLDRTLGPALNRLRRELGLAPVQRILGRWLHSPQGAIGLFPSWFAPPQPDWPAGLQLTGFPLFDGGGDAPLDDELLAFLGRGPAPVVVTPGSSTLQGPAFFAAALQALQQNGQRGVLLGAWAADLQGLGPDMLARRYVPLSRLLPHAQALLHHGGVGTSALALAAGVPQLITPFAHDQFDNAARVARIGAGLTLPAGAALQALAAGLQRLQRRPEFRARSLHWQGLTAPPERAREQVALALEDLLRRSRPTPWAASPSMLFRPASPHVYS